MTEVMKQQNAYHRALHMIRDCILTLSCAVVCTGILQSQTPDAQAKFRLAQGFEQASEWDRAAELYRDLLVTEPGNFAYFDGLQRMYVQLKRYEDAGRVIRERITLMPNDPMLYGMLGTVEYRAGHEPEATRAWERAIDIAPTNQQSYRLVATLMIENRLLDRAAEVYRRGRAACGDQQLFTFELAQLLVASMDYAGATEEYVRWLEQNPAQIAFVENRLAAFSYKDEGRAAATRVVQSRLDRQPTPGLYEILAWLYMEGKEFDQAFQVYRRIDDNSSADGVALLGFADRAVRERSYDVATRAYREALSRPLPAQRVPQAMYGNACALKELQVAADSADVLTVTGIRTAGGARARLTEAVGAFNAIAGAYPGTEYAAKSLYQIGLIQLRQFQDLDGAASTFQRVLADPSANPSMRNDVQLRMAELLIARADTTNAAAALQTVAASRNATPDQTDEAQLHLAELALFNGRIDDAVKSLSAISTNLQNDFANDAIALQVLLQKNAGASPQALILYGRAEYLARQHRTPEAVQQFMELAKRYPATPLIDDALLRAGGLLAQAGRYRDALGVYDSLLTHYREQSKMLDYALLSIGEVHQYGLGQPAEAIGAYERLLSDYPQSVLVNEARRRIRMLRGESL